MRLAWLVEEVLVLSSKRVPATVQADGDDLTVQAEPTSRRHFPQTASIASSTLPADGIDRISFLMEHQPVLRPAADFQQNVRPLVDPRQRWDRDSPRKRTPVREPP